MINLAYYNGLSTGDTHLYGIVFSLGIKHFSLWKLLVLSTITIFIVYINIYKYI